MTAIVIGETTCPASETLKASAWRRRTEDPGGVDFEFIEQAFVDYDHIVLYEVLPSDGSDPAYR